MRAVVVNEIGNRDSVRLMDLPDATAGPGEVLVDVAAMAVNYPDLLMLDGKYQIRPDPPFILGKDAAGTVAAVGDGVTGISPGERVMLYVHYGAFAELVAAPAGHCFVLPDDMDFETAAASGVAYQTAYLALVERGALRAGETVLVTGAAGGIGLALVSLAKALGAATVLAGLTTPAKAGPVREAGADHIIDLSGPDLRDSVRDQVKAATGGGQVDVVVDVVGADIFDACLRTLGWCGRAVVLGFTGGRIPEVKTNYLLLKNISVVGSTVNGYYARDREAVARAQAAVFDLYRQGRIKPRIAASYPLEEFADALALVERRQVVGRAVITIRGRAGSD